MAAVPSKSTHQMNVTGLSFVVASLAAGACLLAAAENRWPLRRPSQPQLRRQGRNLAVAAVAGAVVSLLERPLLKPLTEIVDHHRWGLLNALRLPSCLRVAMGVALMDYSLYAWHRLVHRVPWLWRLHLPHHADLDLDASTALRFHFTELAASVPWRAAQVAAIGVGPQAYSVWQALTTACILFHHSNLRLPDLVERRLSWIVATPRMHGIHHSTVRDETDANFSSGIGLWDRLHGTFRMDVPQQEIEIGTPAWRDPRELTLGKLLALPFRRQRPTWRDSEGRTPRRGADQRLTKEFPE